MKLKDIDKAEPWSTTPILPVGWHDVKITEAKEGESRNGFPQIELQMESHQGEIRDWIVDTETTKGKIKQVLEAARMAIESGEWELNPEDLVGKNVRVNVQEETFEGKRRKKVKAYTPPINGGDTDTPGDEADLPF